MSINSFALIFMCFFLSGYKSTNHFDGLMIQPQQLQLIQDDLSEDIERVIELEKRLLELLYQSKDYRLKVINFPPQQEGDIEGDAERMQKHFNKVISIVNEQNSIGIPQKQLDDIKFEQYLNLNEERRRIIENLMTEAVYDKGIFSIMSNGAGIHGFYQRVMLNRFNESGRLLEAFENLPTGTLEKQVSWNSVLQQYEFKDSDLAILVTKILLVAYTQPEIFKKMRDQVPLDKLQKLRMNSQSDNGASKFETFDLFQGILANYLQINHWEVREMGRLRISKMAHRYLYDLFLSTPAEDARGGNIQKIYAKKQLGDRITLICVGPIAYGNPDYPNVIDYGGISSFEVSFAEAEDYSFFKCGEEEYSFSMESENEIIFPEPVAYNLDDFRNGGPVKASVYISLIGEVSGKISKIVELFLRHKGFHVKERELVETLPALKADFEDSHMIIPAAHALDINNFHLGTNESTRLILAKTVKNEVTGEKVPIEVYFYLPIAESGNLRVPGVELASWMQSRRRNMEVPLFVMNASCGSEHNNGIWNSIYHLSILADLKEGHYDVSHLPRDFVYSIGSATYFDTSTPAQVLQDFVFPIAVLDSLSSGATVRRAIEAISVPPKEDPFIETLKVLLKGQAWWNNLKSRNKGGNAPTDEVDVPTEETPTGYPNGFDPVFNMDDPNVLVGRTVYLLLIDKSNPERVLRF